MNAHRQCAWFFGPRFLIGNGVGLFWQTESIFSAPSGAGKSTKSEGFARVFGSITYVIEPKTRLEPLRLKRKFEPVRASFEIQNELYGGRLTGPDPKSLGTSNAVPVHNGKGGRS
jgi:hypothetical protein